MENRNVFFCSRNWKSQDQGTRKFGVLWGLLSASKMALVDTSCSGEGSCVFTWYSAKGQLKTVHSFYFYECLNPVHEGRSLQVLITLKILPLNKITMVIRLNLERTHSSHSNSKFYPALLSFVHLLILNVVSIFGVHCIYITVSSLEAKPMERFTVWDYVRFIIAV